MKNRFGGLPVAEKSPQHWKAVKKKIAVISSPGNSVGGLWAYGPQVLHGNGPNPPGGLGPVCHSQRLV